MTTEQPTAPRARLPITIVCFVLVTMLAAYAVFVAQHSHQTLRSLTQTLQQERKSSHRLAATLAMMRNTQAELQTELSQLNQQIATQQNFKIQHQLWITAQAHYNLELAHLEAGSEYPEISTCERLLRQTQKLLLPMHDNTLAPVQDAINEALTNLNALPHLNLAKVFKKIYQLEDSLYAAMQPSTTTTTPTPKVPPSSTWQAHVQRSLETLKGLITIKQYDVSTLPEVTLQGMILMNRIALNLQEAGFALSTRNAEIYQLALKQAQLNVNAAFDDSTYIKQSLLTGLTELTSVPLGAKIPSLNKPLDALNEWMKTYAAGTVPEEKP